MSYSKADLCLRTRPSMWLRLFFFFFECWVLFLFYLFIFYLFFKISWRLITLQYCSGFCHTLTWISLGYTCIQALLFPYLHCSPSDHVLTVMNVFHPQHRGEEKLRGFIVDLAHHYTVPMLSKLDKSNFQLLGTELVYCRGGDSG